MDEMKIKSPFLKDILSMMISNRLAKKLGYSVRVDVHDIEVKIVDGKIQADIDLHCEADKEILWLIDSKVSD